MTEQEVAAENNEQDKKEEGLEEPTDLENDIIRQVEYYFGDLNLPRDKFLREQIKLDEGWVPLEIMIKFNRLAKLTTDLEAIAKALNKSTTGLLEVSEDNKKIRRSPEMPIPEMNEERRKELLARTVYAKGFPKDVQLDDLLKYFKQFAEVDNVVMRRYLDRKTKERIFKGSVFVTFKTKEQAEKFMSLDAVKHEETELIRKWQDAYFKEKQEETTAKREKRDKDKKKKPNNENGEAKEEFKLPTGTTLRFNGGHDKMSREDIKEALTKLGAEIAYIDFKVGETEGWIRLTKENTAKEFFEKITDGKIKIGEAEVEFKLPTDEEEQIFLAKTVEEMVKRRKNLRNFKQNRGRNNFKGKGRKRRQDGNDDGPPAKVTAES